MAVTPGSATKLNNIKGIAKMLPVTDADFTGEMGDRKFDANILLAKSDGTVYVTDGKTALKDLAPRIDQVLVKAEKDALAAAFTGEDGAYLPAAGGVVLHGADGKIDDVSFKFIEDGKIKQAYLSDFLGEDGMIKLEALPATVRAGVKFFGTYADMDSKATDENKKGFCFVLDAKDDPSGKVGKGGAVYAWIDTTPEATDENPSPAAEGHWEKFAEQESLDLDMDAITPSYDNVEAAGAVMYDHPVVIGGMTLSELAALEAAGTTEPEVSE